ncbi:UvrD-helicase domain-containing protein [Ravibacter arvi]|uniref:DNA 3'-5' helicase n=1 Tax=Ravibacter arvi TaxID=2051041 RepID=A0ABP8LUL8_9BACT
MFKIYSSSAGSGKTYTLTKEYIKLALNETNDSYYRHILAVTFTNAAAQEMKERILLMLRLFADNPKHPMLLDIAKELYPESAGNTVLLQEKTDEIGRRAARIFTRILHGYADFSVMTIDSFTSRLVGSFTDELGLPFGFETRLDSDFLTEAIDRVLARIGLTGEETLSEVVEKYYLEHARAEGAWGALPRHMLNAAGDLLNEQSYLSMSRVSDLTLTDWQQIRQQLLTFLKEKESLITGLANDAFQSIESAGLSPSDFFQSARGIYGYFSARAQAGNTKVWEAPNSYVTKTIEEEKWSAGKVSTHAALAIENICGALTGAYRQIETIRDEYGGLAALFKAIAGQLFSLSLLNEIKREFDRLLRQNNQVHISEFNRKIIEIVANDPVPFIFERLGEKYHHILIDEFQDTSRLQFANLLPLIENALSYGHFNLIVGDVKQAIYRFRGGDMELLLKLSGGQAAQITQLFDGSGAFMADRLHLVGSQTDLARLSVNRRSFQEITAFNNDFFDFLARTNDRALGKAVYDEHFRQASGPATPSGGHIQIDFFEGGKTDDNEEIPTGDEPDENTAPDPQVGAVIAQIQSLVSEGYDFRDIAVLCRYKKNAAKLAVWLQSSGVPLVSDDSLLLANSKYVALVVSFLKILHNPASVSLKLETALSLLQIRSPNPPGGAEMDKIAIMSRSGDPEVFFNWLSGFGIRFDTIEPGQLGLYELCEQIIARLQLNPDPVEYQYVFRFLDEVLRFEANRVSHLGDFLNWWEMSGKALSVTASDETNAVRITTVHKSKGLEYPVVIFPYADWKATPKPGTRLWVNLDHVEASELTASNDSPAIRGSKLATVAIPLSKNLEETPVAAQYLDEVDRVLLENINLTYVAFTRPVQRLYLLAALPTLPKSPTASPPASLHFWLQSYLEEKGVWSPGQLRYILADGTRPQSVDKHIEPGAAVVLTAPFGKGETANVQIKRNPLFEPGETDTTLELNRKLRHMMSLLPSADLLRPFLKKQVLAGLLRPEEVDVLEEKISEVLRLPGLDTVFAASNTRLSGEIIQQGGDLLEADKIVRTPEGRYLVALFAENNRTATDKIRRLMTACSAGGLEKVTGLLVDIFAEPVQATWFN